MGTVFWIKRFFTVAALACLILLAVELLKGHALALAAENSLFWGLISASIFTATRYYHARRGRACALCRDTPEQ